MTANHRDDNQSADDHDDRGPITWLPPRYKMAIVTMGVILERIFIFRRAQRDSPKKPLQFKQIAPAVGLSARKVISLQ